MNASRRFVRAAAVAAATTLLGGACAPDDAPGATPGELAATRPSSHATSSSATSSPATSSSEAAPPASVRRERPRELPPLPEGWRTVAVGEIAAVDVPGDLVDETLARDCGRGPAVRILRGDRLEVRVEVGNELTYLPLKPGDEKDTLVRVHQREPWQVGARQATHLRFDEPRLSSRALAPDGSWPSFETIEAVHVDGVAVASPPAAPLGQLRGPVAVAVRITGARDAKTIATILRSLEVL